MMCVCLGFAEEKEFSSNECMELYSPKTFEILFLEKVNMVKLSEK